MSIERSAGATGSGERGEGPVTGSASAPTGLPRLTELLRAYAPHDGRFFGAPPTADIAKLRETLPAGEVE